MKSAHTRIYADNAATTRLSEKALEGMLPWLREGFGNPSSLHRWGCEAKRAIREARENIAKLIGADTEEIFFTSGGTESDNWAIKGVFDAKGGTGSNIVTSPIEHHAVLNVCEAVAKKGCEIRFLQVNKMGVVNLQQLSDMIDEKTILVSVMMANNEIGTFQDLQKIVEIAHSNGILVHTDAVQAVGHIPLKVHELNVDLLSASAHKFNGPKGVGFLYIRKGIKLPSLLQGGVQEFGLRAGTENVASIVGMSLALQEHIIHFAERYSHVEHLSSMLKRGLYEMNHGIQVNGSQELGGGLPGIVNVTIPGQSGEGLMHILDMKGIAISTGAACNSKSTIVSHVLRAILLPDNLAKSTIRISLSYENTETDVHDILGSIQQIISKTE